MPVDKGAELSVCMMPYREAAISRATAAEGDRPAERLAAMSGSVIVGDESSDSDSGIGHSLPLEESVKSRGTWMRASAANDEEAG